MCFSGCVSSLTYFGWDIAQTGISFGRVGWVTSHSDVTKDMIMMI